MRSLITVREYARLTTDVVEASLDEATVSCKAFDWLCEESSRWRKGGASLVHLDGRRSVRLDNYVGVMEAPDGTRIEVLPKHMDGMDDAPSARRLLRRMLTRCMGIQPRESRPTDLQTFHAPLDEWVMHQFLQHLEYLVKRGVRFDYHAVREQQRFLRGRLDLPRQLRQPPGRQHLFQIEHEVFDADRAENRLLCSALDRVVRRTRHAENWRLSRELASYLAEVPRSADIPADFGRWRDNRLMAHYRPVRPWCSLILNEQSPKALLGDWRGPSLLFPMQELFERFVETCLRRDLPAEWRLVAQASSHYLCRHRDQEWFRLKPDFLLQAAETTFVLDAKWKRLDASLANSRDKYGLSQADFYQLYAYGQHYLGGKGDLFLIFPMTESFNASLPPFLFSERMRLWVVPFDLANETCPALAHMDTLSKQAHGLRAQLAGAL